MTDRSAAPRDDLRPSAARQLGTDAELEGWLRTAHAMCDAADQVALEALRGRPQVTAKPDGSFVTDADQAVERLIREHLAEAHPDHAVVGEEYGSRDAGETVRWYVDPIDGTHNFMRGIPVFATLLGVERDGELQVGMVSAPALGRRWWARRGGGAWSRDVLLGGPDQAIHVSTDADVRSMQLLYGNLAGVRQSAVAGGFDALVGEVWRERGLGDFWGYTLVAGGSAEAMLEPELHVWDIAGPWVVVEEAGGRITDLAGRRDWHAGSALASNGVLHDTILEHLHRA